MIAVVPETPAAFPSVQDMLDSDDFDDMGFLEDFLLPDTTMIPGCVTSVTSENESTLVPSIDDGGMGRCQNLLSLSALQTTTTSNLREESSEPSYLKVLSTSNREIEEFRKILYCICPHGLLQSFRFPSRSRIVRCIVAYFDHFDPHTPIIQHAKFSLCGSHPALVLIILAIGAMYLSEKDFSLSAYQVACSLLDAYPIDQRKQSLDQYEFGPLQAMLLCAQFGVFTGQETFVRHSQQQFAAVSDALKDDIGLLKAERTVLDQTWDRWSFIETFTRLATWTCTLSAMLLADDPTSAYMAPYQLREVPFPLGEELWRARSATQWAALPDNAKLHGDSNLSRVAEALLQGKPIPENISSFSLLSLVAWALTYICTQEKFSMSIGPVGLFNDDFRVKMERVLLGWEIHTRRRMKADRAIYRQTDPLFTDCFPLLGSSYYHLYLGDELRALKEKAAREDTLPAGTKVGRDFPAVPSPHLAHKAILYAANSWLVRAKQGIGNFNDTSSINYGGHYLMSAYESGKFDHFRIISCQTCKCPTSRQANMNKSE